MVGFCPHCGTMLMLEKADCMRFYCPTCPYVSPIEDRMVSQLNLRRKAVDDVLGGEAAWANAQRTDLAVCERCGTKSAFFMQIQIRSADEPMTTFYKCANFKCGFQWRDG